MSDYGAVLDETKGTDSKIPFKSLSNEKEGVFKWGGGGGGG